MDGDVEWWVFGGGREEVEAGSRGGERGKSKGEEDMGGWMVGKAG